MNNLWVCMDIVGTYGDLKTRMDQKENVFEMMEQIRILGQYENIIFSFISSDEIIYVKEFVKEVSVLLQDYPSIFLGPQIGNNGVFYPDRDLECEHIPNFKGIQMLTYGKEINLSTPINGVIYIDDHPRRHLSFLNLEEDFHQIKDHLEFVVIGKRYEKIGLCDSLEFYAGEGLQELEFVLNGLEQYKEKLKVKVKKNEEVCCK